MRRVGGTGLAVVVGRRHATLGRGTGVLTSGRITDEVGGNIDAMPCGGIAAVHRMVTKLGLPEQIDEGLQLLKVHLPYHESDHVLNLAYNVLCSGTRLEDNERLRHDTAYMNALCADLIPDPTTACYFCRLFAEKDVIELMDRVNTVRPLLWRTRGRDLLDPVAYVDIDGTIVPTDGKRKAGIGLSYKGIWGYCPLLVTLANTKEVLYLVNRPGNAPSHQDAAGWIDKAIDLVSPHAPRVCLRGDTDFSLTAHFDRWAQRVDFVFGMDANAALTRIADGLDESSWRRLQRQAPYQNTTGQTRARREDHKGRIVTEKGYLNLELNHEDVAEFDYRPGKCRRGYRVVALRKNISRSKGEADAARRGPLLLLHHHPHRPDRRGDRRPGQRALRPGERHRRPQVGHRRAPRAAVRPGQQLGLHGHRRPGLEHQVLVRADDAPQGRPSRLHPHGVPPLLPRPHPHPRHDPPPGPRHHRPADRLHPRPRPALQRLDHHRNTPLRLTPPSTRRRTRRRTPAAATPHAQPTTSTTRIVQNGQPGVCRSRRTVAQRGVFSVT